MKSKRSSKILAGIICVLLIVGMIPFSAIAYNADYQSETHTVFRHTEQTLAPGVDYYNNYAYLNDGEQVVYYVAVADINRDDVLVQGSYWNMQTEQYGMSKLTEQVAAANAKYTDPNDPDFISANYTVVAGTNGDFYNMQTGRPSGAFAINGHVMNESNNRPWFAIFEDGTALCGANATDYAAAVAAHGPVQNSVGGSQLLVKDGADVTANASGSYNTDRHSRTMIGVTADNKVVSAVVDGRQSPFSDGGTMHELAQIMLEAECVMAINLDGGGSTTFGARPEGEDSFRVINRPSDGSERSVSSGVIIASLAAPSDVFDHANITFADEYITPGTSASFTAVGVSPAGTSADIPAEVTYTATLGSVVDGTFVSDGTVGDAVVTAIYNGEPAGSATIHVVVPDSIEFDQATFTVPYGKTMDLGITAKYGLNKVVTKPADFIYTLDVATGAGEIADGAMVAPEADSEAEGNVVTATLVYDNTKTATANVAFGKASEVIFDFEDGTTQKWVRYNTSNYNYIHTRGSTSVATAENGQVHSGNYSLKVVAKFSETWEAGYISGRLGVYGLDEIIDLKGATRLGFWMYIPVANASFNGRMFLCKVTERDPETGAITKYAGYYTDPTIDGTDAANCGFITQYDEPGWHYVSFDLSGGDDWCIINNATLYDFYINDRNGDAYGYNHLNYKSQNNDLILYIDDVTVDYSSVVEDRERPIFQSVLLGDRGNHSNDALVLTNGYESDGFGQISLSARVADDTTKSNYSGLNAASAKAYIDGNEVPCTYANGLMSIDEYTFTDGKHTVKFAISDNNGNSASAVRTFSVVNTGNAQPVWIEAKDPSLDRILLGSLYWVNVKALDASAVAGVSLDLDLNNLSVWELDHMEVADGFDADYTVVNADENVVRLTITANGGAIALLDGDAIVSMPIRTWELPPVAANYGHAGVVWMYDKYRAGNEVWPVDVNVKVAAGKVTFGDGSDEIFTGEAVQVDTESIYWDNDNAKASDPYYTSWNGGHDHRPETAEYYGANATNHTTAEDIIYVAGFEPAAETCTEDGFTGRTFCTVCNSVVDWGEVIPATGHTFAIDDNDGLLKCTVCGDLCNEEIDGILYENGAPAHGWIEDSYYVDGVALTGIAEADGYYYDFGEDGVCEGRFKYSGLLVIDGANHCVKNGELVNGWQSIDEEWYFFDLTTGAGLNGTWNLRAFGYVEPGTFEFVDGKLQSGVWFNYDNNKTKYCYGPGTYFRTWKTIDGGEYYFDIDGYVLKGYERLRDNPKSITSPNRWYHFDETTGLLLERLTDTGIVEIDGKLVYMEEGVSTYAGLIQIGDDYYYVNSNGDVVVDKLYRITKNNDLLPIDDYLFGTDGKIIFPEPVEPKNGLVEEDGVIHYYVDGVLTYAGLIEIDGDYYYINSRCEAVTSKLYRITKNNDLLPIDDYLFGADGKILNVPGHGDDQKHGLVEEDGVLRYYENGIPTYAGLIEIDGDYYYINSHCEAVTGKLYRITKNNDLLPIDDYLFGDDGKILNVPEPIDTSKNGLVEEDGVIHYYVDGVLTYAGLIQIDGDYYYINSHCEAVTGKLYRITKNNDLLPIDDYLFGDDGKILNVPAAD